MDLPLDYPELALYVVAGEIVVGNRSVAAGSLALLSQKTPVRISAAAPAHVMLIGGESFDKRHIWWNFVSSSRRRIEQAKADWREDKFARVPGEHEWIPLPDE